MDKEIIDKIVKLVIEKLQKDQKEQIKNKIANPIEPTYIIDKLVTEEDIKNAVTNDLKILYITKKAIITPLAKDTAKEKKIKIEIWQETKDEKIIKLKSNIIALGSDHRGYELKEEIKKYLVSNGKKIRDYGTYSLQSCDYPDYAKKVAEVVAKGECITGIMIDGAGFASAIVCNKIKGIRATTCWDLYTTRLAREHIDANILCIGGQVLGAGIVIEMVKVWLEMNFLGGKYQLKNDKINEIEKNILK